MWESLGSGLNSRFRTWPRLSTDSSGSGLRCAFRVCVVCVTVALRTDDQPLGLQWSRLRDSYAAEMRPTRAEIDLGAVAHNVRTLGQNLGDVEFCAVVKADGYAHGAVAVAKTALRSGADRLAVALVDEGVVLREAGISAPILLLSEPRPEEMAQVVAFDLTPTVYSGQGVGGAAAAAAAANIELEVHLKIDTGMHRVGVAPDDAVAFATAIADKRSLRLAGVYSHCAVADEPDNPFTSIQLDRFQAALEQLRANGFDPGCVHFANSAAAITRPDARFDMVRVGIGMYGVAPARDRPGAEQLQPAMSLHTEVAFVKSLLAGEAVSYGLRWTSERDTTIATLPVGYADGLRRSLFSHGGTVLIRGKELPIVGAVTMDQTLVDCGPFTDVEPGDAVVLLGRQGEAEITAHDVADRLGTIPYEVVCDVTPRLRRRYY